MGRNHAGACLAHVMAKKSQEKSENMDDRSSKVDDSSSKVDHGSSKSAQVASEMSQQKEVLAGGVLTNDSGLPRHGEAEDDRSSIEMIADEVAPHIAPVSLKRIPNGAELRGPLADGARRFA